VRRGARREPAVYRCQECGFAGPKPGTCPDCARGGTYLSLVEERVAPGRAERGRARAPEPAQPLAAVRTEVGDRLRTGLGELDRVLGGGVVHGSLVLIGGDPGIGKSTLLLQASEALAAAAPPVLYVSGEESAGQIKLRSDRLGIEAGDVYLLAEADLTAVEAQVDALRPRALVVDSIQTVYLPQLESAPGSVAQVRECGARLMMLAKTRGIATFLVGHVTKEGALAGPRVLEHLVDTVLYFEGERHHTYRILRAVKNRFGSTNELGVFRMEARGLCEVPNPSGFFLAERPTNAAGSVVTACLEGTRPILLEVQALVAPASFTTPRRAVIGADYNRLAVLLAVLEKRAAFPLQTQDVFVNVAGGGRAVEPAADLALAVAVASSYMDRPVPNDVVVVGEIGLAGEVRRVSGLETRLKEAIALGFDQAVVPAAGCPSAPLRSGFSVTGVATVDDALRILLP
jgi:DNA repair protein RadA/Sms